jgi:hypothetical protein
MATDSAQTIPHRQCTALLLAVVLVLGLDACAAGPPLISLVYTRVKLPLTRDLNHTTLPADSPHAGRMIEVREPVTGLGLSARVNSNAIGDIARRHGIRHLYFADQEVFSVLGIWNSRRVILYGDGEKRHRHESAQNSK